MTFAIVSMLPLEPATRSNAARLFRTTVNPAIGKSSRPTEAEEEEVFVDTGAPGTSPVYFYRVRVAE